MTPEQYYSKLKAKIYMRSKLDEFAMKGINHRNLYKNFLNVSRKLNMEEQKFHDEKQIKKINKMIERLKKDSKEIDQKRIQYIKERSFELYTMYKEFCEKAITWKVYSDEEYDDECHRLNDVNEEYYPPDDMYYLIPKGQPGAAYVIEKLSDMELILDDIYEIIEDNREKDYKSMILEDKEYMNKYKVEVHKCYSLLAKISFGQWFFDRLEAIELEYIYDV